MFNSYELQVWGLKKMNREIRYALSKMWQHRKALRTYNKNPTLQISSVLQLDAHDLRKRGIKVIALDIDGVLSTYGEESLSLEIGNWLNHLIQVYDEESIFILSNKPTPNRIEYFCKNFKGLKLIIPQHKKPYPDGIEEILQLKKVNSKELLMIDDRLLTGILAAVIADASALYVTKPLISLTKQPVRELHCIFLRLLERLALN